MLGLGTGARGLGFRILLKRSVRMGAGSHGEHIVDLP